MNKKTKLGLCAITLILLILIFQSVTFLKAYHVLTVEDSKANRKTYQHDEWLIEFGREQKRTIIPTVNNYKPEKVSVEKVNLILFTRINMVFSGLEPNNSEKFSIQSTFFGLGKLEKKAMFSETEIRKIIQASQ